MGRIKGVSYVVHADKVEAALVLIAEGASTHKAARGLGVSQAALWSALNQPQYANRYVRAMLDRGTWYAERAIEVAEEPVAPGDSAAVNDKRLRVDTYKWAAGKLDPKKWGERLELGGLGDALAGVTINMVLTPRQTTNAVLLDAGEAAKALPEAIDAEVVSDSE